MGEHLGLGDELQGLDVLEAQGIAAEVEALPSVAVAQAAEVVGEIVDGDGLAGTPLEGLEGPVAVPGADVEDAPAREVGGNAVGRGMEGVDAGSRDAAGEFD